jgi:hypothetical protein
MQSAYPMHSGGGLRSLRTPERTGPGRLMPWLPTAFSADPIGDSLRPHGPGSGLCHRRNPRRSRAPRDLLADIEVAFGSLVARKGLISPYIRLRQS